MSVKLILKLDCALVVNAQLKKLPIGPNTLNFKEKKL